jgi:hypothetical protein
VQIAELTGRRNTRLAISSRAVTRDDQEWARKGEVRSVAHELVAETTRADGETVAIEAIARVCRARGGCEAFRHEVEVCRDDEAWKVCRFHESTAPDAEVASR